MRDERNTKVQWMNLQRNSSFVNRTQFPLLCEKSGVILLVLVGLTAGRQAGRQAGGQAGGRAGGRAGRQADEILVDFEIFKSLYRSYC